MEQPPNKMLFKYHLYQRTAGSPMREWIASSDELSFLLDMKRNRKRMIGQRPDVVFVILDANDTLVEQLTAKQ